MNGAIIYYGLLITPFLFVTTLMGIEQLFRHTPAYDGRIKLWLILLVVLVHLGNSRLFTQIFEDRYAIPERYKNTAYEMIDMIPSGASVSAQINLISHLPPHPYRTFFPRNLENTDYIFLDSLGNKWPFAEQEYMTYADSIKKSPNWKVAIEKDGFVLLRRN